MGVTREQIDILRYLWDDVCILFNNVISTYNEFKDKIMAYAKKNGELERTVKDIIDDKFYGDYAPIFYNRNYDLRNTFEFYMSHELDFDFKLGAEFMKSSHKASNEWIYENSFVLGWHGGAPKDGSEARYWRKPHPYYYRWGRVAENTGFDLEAYLNMIIPELYDERRVDLSLDFYSSLNEYNQKCNEMTNSINLLMSNL